MNLIPKQPNPSWSIEQLRRHFGMIPAERILLDPPPGTATEKDLLAHEGRRGFPPELVEGVLIDRTGSFPGGILQAAVIFELMNYLQGNDLGIVIASKCPIRLGPKLIRLASVLFISWQQMPHGVPNDPITDLVPELAVEILHPGTTRLEMRSKRRDFFAAGTKLFWLLDLKSQTVDVYSASDPDRRATPKTEIHAGELLPGFTMSVTKLYASLQRPPNR